jgi:KDO2-lipid IV(A) lauroyltransferase
MLQTAPGLLTPNPPEHKGQNRLYRIAFRLLRWSLKLGYGRVMALGRFIGRRIMQLDENHTRIAAINIDLCLPLLSPRQQRELLKNHFENLGMGIAEMALSWWCPDERFEPLIHFKGREHFEKARLDGRGIIFVTAQMTTPDILIRALGKLAPVTAIHRPHHSPFIDNCIVTYRKRIIEQVLGHENITALTQTLNNGHAVLISHDADAGHRHISFEPFFGELAATNTVVNRLARMTGAMVVPVYVARLPDNAGYQVTFESPLPDFPGPDTSADTRRLNQLIERWIERYPEQYDWSFARFRERPEGEPPFY